MIEQGGGQRYAPPYRVPSSQVTVTDEATFRSFTTPVDQRGKGAIRSTGG